jgi:hypothetical protein
MPLLSGWIVIVSIYASGLFPASTPAGRFADLSPATVTVCFNQGNPDPTGESCGPKPSQTMQRKGLR